MHHEAQPHPNDANTEAKQTDGKTATTPPKSHALVDVNRFLPCCCCHCCYCRCSLSSRAQSDGRISGLISKRGDIHLVKQTRNVHRFAGQDARKVSSSAGWWASCMARLRSQSNTGTNDLSLSPSEQSVWHSRRLDEDDGGCGGDCPKKLAH